MANVLSRLREFIERRGESIARVKRLLDDPASLVATDGEPIVMRTWTFSATRSQMPNPCTMRSATRSFMREPAARFALPDIPPHRARFASR